LFCALQPASITAAAANAKNIFFIVLGIGI
jgi:hypothetical protein